MLSARRFAAVAVAVAIAVVLVPCARPSGAQGAADPDLRTLTHGGRQRTYLVHDFGRGRPAPVVLVLHGGGGNGANAVKMTGFDRVASREGLIAVYPEGTSVQTRFRMLTWNAGHCCASAMDGRVDDVGFIGALIDALIASGRADASRIYATGMSNGAMMTHRLGRELSTKIAAIAPVVGAVFGDEPPPQAPVPAFIVVGAEDEIVPGAGGPLRVRMPFGRRSADRDAAPALAQATYWARANGCGEPVRTEAAAYRKTAWASCRSRAPVIFVSVLGNGHAWPGGQPGREGAAQPTKAYDASEEIWSFFETQSRRERR
jgi:polyhydroxybutyrate depolymerase